jgi:MFS family permease
VRRAEEVEGASSKLYSRSVFDLTVLLMLSDYASRQVVAAVFPFLKAEWTLSDAQLGSLTGVVMLFVGVMTFPISLLADRWGRVKKLRRWRAYGVWRP